MLRDLTNSELVEKICERSEAIVEMVKMSEDNLKAMNTLQKLENWDILNRYFDIDATINEINNVNIRVYKKVEEAQKTIKECTEILINPFGH